MDKAGSLEIVMPMVQPAELWMESGRWQKYGDELLRLKDRHGREFALQPTSEEVVTDIARQEINSGSKCLSTSIKFKPSSEMKDVLASA